MGAENECLVYISSIRLLKTLVTKSDIIPRAVNQTLLRISDACYHGDILISPVVQTNTTKLRTFVGIYDQGHRRLKLLLEFLVNFGGTV